MDLDRLIAATRGKKPMPELLAALCVIIDEHFDKEAGGDPAKAAAAMRELGMTKTATLFGYPSVATDTNLWNILDALTPGVAVADDDSIDALTVKQRDVLGAICCNQDSGHNPRTLASLERQGLIVGYTEVRPGRPPVEIKRWDVPPAVHIRWTEWCATQPETQSD